MSKMVTITVDERAIEAKQGEMLLETLKGIGLAIPTLCHSPSLTPNGACRLCVVEITKEPWKGWSQLVTSCLFPVEEGLIVSTRSQNVIATRQTLLEMYLADSPHSEKLKEIARLEGVDTTSFPIKSDGDACVLCGLCTRVCNERGPAALAPLGRGAEKAVGPNPDKVGEDCTGCLACSYICPTDAIETKHHDQQITIWNREFEVATCKVSVDQCRGCGVCEEVCPYSIPRVSLYNTGVALSHINANACVGCGICAGACPDSAIKQKITKELSSSNNPLNAHDLRGKKIVFACSRSKLPKDMQDIVPVSCIGSVTVDTMLHCLARGTDGVMLMCRDQETCPYHRGGKQGKQNAEIANTLAHIVGLGENRVRYTVPQIGQIGPKAAVLNFYANTTATLLHDIYPEQNSTIDFSGMDRALVIMDWLKERKELSPNLPTSYRIKSEDSNEEQSTLLYLDNLVELDLLLSPIIIKWRLADVVQKAISLLQQQNIQCKPVFTRREVEQSHAAKIITFNQHSLPTDATSAKVITLDSILSLQKSDNPMKAQFSFRLSKQNRKELIQRLEKEPKLLCDTPQELAQYKLLLREGSWWKRLDYHPYCAFEDITTTDTVRSKEDQKRIAKHPILPQLTEESIPFTFNGKALSAQKGEVISSALYAAGISVFGHHHKDGGAQGIFCVNGQCSQCTVVANGRAVKSCMTPVMPGMEVSSCEGAPSLATAIPQSSTPEVDDIATPVLIIGGGPSGICAAIELGRLGVEVLLIDDKQELGGKLSLQTHNFFGSVADCFAGDRGIDIGNQLAQEVQDLPTVTTWLNSTVVGVFDDGKFGVASSGTFRLVTPERVLITTGAREKSLSFPGCDLPGVYGAGAFQTLVNRDLVKSADKLFIVGGGNVGLIGAYHALQAGIDVVGLVEALPECGGYKVHEDKIKRLGVPVMTSHTVLRIEGNERAERIVIAEIKDTFKPISGTERSFDVDTVLIAVGLSPVDELLKKTREYGMKVYAAGDAEEIAEASAAIFSGKITGRKIAKDMGIDIAIPSNWESFGELLKHRPGKAIPFKGEERELSVYPLIRCVQEIPCNPCTEACPKDLITMPESILTLPEYHGECLGCGRCVLACPGLAISLVINDYDQSKETALLMLPFEFNTKDIPIGKEVITTDLEGAVVGTGKIIAVKDRESFNKRKLLLLEVPQKDKLLVAGFQIRKPEKGDSVSDKNDHTEDPMICRCERVRKSEIVKEIRAGVRDMNQLKAIVRAGLGGCNGKTCTELILRIFKEEGVPLSEITLPSNRPLVAEIHLGDFVKKEHKEGTQ